MTKQTIAKPMPDIIWKKVQGEIVLLNPETGEYFGLNETGSAFFEKLDGRRSFDEILRLMQDEFEVEDETLRQDVLELAEVLASKGLIHAVA